MRGLTKNLSNLLITNYMLILKTTTEKKLMLYTHWCKESNDLLKNLCTYEEAFREWRQEIATKMKEYEPLSKLLDDIIQQMAEGNIHEDNTDSEMPSKECINKEDIEKQKFDIGPYLSQKKKDITQALYSLKKVYLIQITMNCLLPQSEAK